MDCTSILVRPVVPSPFLGQPVLKQTVCVCFNYKIESRWSKLLVLSSLPYSSIGQCMSTRVSRRELRLKTQNVVSRVALPGSLA